MLALGILLAATTAAPSCPSLPADLAELLPTTVTTAVALDVDAFTKTAVGKAVLPALHGDLQLSEALEILGDCGITLERTYSLLAARDDDDGRLVLVQGHQLGEDATLACLGHELRARNDGVDPWTRSQGGACIDRLELVDGSRAWIANDYTLIWARGDDFAASIEGTLTGARAHVVPPRLEPVLRRTDRKTQVWVAALLDLAQDLHGQNAPFGRGQKDDRAQGSHVAGEGEDQTGQKRRRNQRQGDLAEGTLRIGAQRCRRLLDGGIDLLQGSHAGAQ